MLSTASSWTDSRCRVGLLDWKGFILYCYCSSWIKNFGCLSIFLLLWSWELNPGSWMFSINSPHLDCIHILLFVIYMYIYVQLKFGCIYLSSGVRDTCHGAHMEVREQSGRVISLLPTRASQGLASSYQTWCQCLYQLSHLACPLLYALRQCLIKSRRVGLNSLWSLG